MSADVGEDYDSSISKLSTEIERMAPNMKAMTRFVLSAAIEFESFDLMG